MDNDIMTPDLLTTDELRELDDLGRWIDELFIWAGMPLSDSKIEQIVGEILVSDDECEAAVNRVRDRLMTELSFGG